MVNAVYDHLIAILVVGAMFVGTVVVLPSMSFVNLQAVDQQQLRNTALNVFNAMLLDPGDPADWGSIDPNWSSGAVKRFGLAPGQNSTFYVLDPDKVQRLVKGNPLGELSYAEAKDLLGLQGYGFSFRIIPPFNVTNVNGTKIDTEHSPLEFVGPPTYNTLRCAIKVSYLDGRPIPNATVQGTLFYTSKDDFFITPSNKDLTDALGICRKDTALCIGQGDIKSLITVLSVTVSDVATIVVIYKSGSVNIVDINLVRDTMILTRTLETPRDNVWINNATFIRGGKELVYLFNSSRKNDKDYQLNTGAKRMWERSFYGLSKYDPVVFVLNFWAVDKGGRGRSEIVIAGPCQNLMGYSVFEYGDPPRSSHSVVKIQRSVVISSMTYTAELWLWKESP